MKPALREIKLPALVAQVPIRGYLSIVVLKDFCLLLTACRHTRAIVLLAGHLVIPFVMQRASELSFDC
jgi:hypothetical protein